MNAATECEKKGENIIHLEVGQPATGAPNQVIGALEDAINIDRLGYTLAFGRIDLRQRIARHYEDFYGFYVDPERIAVTAGSSGAFVLAFLAAFDAGNHVALADPSYPAYRNILSALDINVVKVPTSSETNFQLTIDGLMEAERKNGRLDGLIIASPANPTGAMLNKSELKSIVDYCSQNYIRLISDEIYHGITYTMEPESVARFCDQSFVINSFSKYFSMTGWRLGWMIMPSDLIRPLECLSQNLFISPSALSQVGGIAAFDCYEELNQKVGLYSKNRDLLVSKLPKAGFSNLVRSDGAFYIYANIENLAHDSVDLCQRLLVETGVAITPGTDFDPIRGHEFVRFSFAGQSLDIEEATDRLIKWHCDHSQKG